MRMLVAILIGFYLNTLPTWAEEGRRLVLLSHSVNSCASDERWFKIPIPQEGTSEKWLAGFSKYLQGKNTAIGGFSEALALRRLAANRHERVFSEYWLSRVLLGSGLVHLAESGFKTILSYETSREVSSFQFASLNCLNQIRRKYGLQSVNGSTLPHIRSLAATLSGKTPHADTSWPILWESSLNLIAQSPEFQTPEVLSLLKNAGPYESLALGIYHSYNHAGGNSSQEVVRNLTSFFSNPQTPAALTPYSDHAALLLGRAFYSQGRFDQAEIAYRKVSVRSNEWVHALSELAWSYLMAGKYREAIGVGVGIQTGALKHTFSPESLMVMAMALNEMCYFPESLKLVSKFKRDYQSSYFWLKDYLEKSRDEVSPYHLAIDFARNLPTSKTPPIASEWIRSPVFLTHQERINLVIREKQTADRLTMQGLSEQRALAFALLNEMRKVKKDYLSAKIKMKPGESLPPKIAQQMQEVLHNLTRYQWMRTAAPTWRMMFANLKGRAESVSRESVSQIESHISKLNQRMFQQLQEIAANHELLEVEIFNGASEDIIWQNAHPDYKNVVSKFKNLKNEQSSEAVWEWGNNINGLNGEGEIWEDEVGSLTANLHNNCESKDKYLAVKHQLQADL